MRSRVFVCVCLCIQIIAAIEEQELVSTLLKGKDESLCAVKIKGEGECLATVEDYNKFAVLTQEYADGNSIVQARKRIAKSLIDCIFVKEHKVDMPENIYKEQAEMFRKEIDKHVETIIQNKVSKRIPVSSDSDHGDMLVYLWGSSDSLVSQGILDLIKKDSLAPELLLRKYGGGVVLEASLGDMLYKWSEIMKTGQMSEIVTMPFGYYFLLLGGVAPAHISREYDIQSGDKTAKQYVAGEDLWGFYRENKDLFKRQDTIDISVKCIPGFVFKDSVGKLNELLLRADLQSKKVTVFDLPEIVKTAVVGQWDSERCKVSRSGSVKIPHTHPT